jgi:hypothetical protein
MARGRKANLNGLQHEHVEDGTFVRNASSRPGLLSGRALTSPFAAPVYEEDVHLTLTEALALAAGFGIAEAREIAVYNQDVDNDRATTPMPLGLWDETSGAGTKRRRLWHFTSPARQAQVKREYQQSGSLRDLGRYMHVLQDSYSHKDLNPIIGQFGTSVDPRTGETVYNSPNPLDSAPWHEADDPSRNPGKAISMAYKSYEELVEAREYLAKRGKLRVSFEAVDYLLISKLVSEFCHHPDKNVRNEKANQIGTLVLQHRKQQEDAEYSEMRAQFEETERRRTQTIQPRRKKPQKRRN